MVADGICMEQGCEDDVSEARRCDLKLDVVSNSVDGLANVKYAVDVVDAAVAEWLSIYKMDSFERILFYCGWVGQHVDDVFGFFVAFVGGSPGFYCGEF
jgi:hypothetical protein